MPVHVHLAAVVAWSGWVACPGVGPAVAPGCRRGAAISAGDIPELLALGVAAVFAPGTPTREITDWVHTRPGRAAV
ncbi:hypothetical protein [Streptomyces canus]|uniref:hypothetical protein n=1 Tax=Streptomyces canus TaxID=58343 RepID=UPI00325504B4